MELSDLNKAGILFYDVHALVANKTIGTAKNGKEFANIPLKAGSATVRGIKWSYNAEKYDELLTTGTVVKVSGKSEMYNNDISFTFETIEPSDKKPEDFVRRTRFDVARMYADIQAVLGTFTEPLPKFIADYLLTNHKDEFCRAPAAMGMHQAWVGGLLEHTHNLLSLALPIVTHYQNRYGSQHFSRDKVLFGVIVHDLGKIMEYDIANLTFKTTPNGLLSNHIVKGAIMVHDAASFWFHGNRETVDVAQFEFMRDQLVHLVSSHHGTLEYGSPVVPQTLEALLLHQLDMIDSQFMHALDMVEGKQGDVLGFSDRSKFKGNPRFLQQKVSVQ